MITFVSTLLLSLIGYQIVPVYVLGISMVTIHGAVYSVLRRYQVCALFVFHLGDNLKKLKLNSRLC